MYFDDDLEMYVIKIENIFFACEDEPTYDYEENLRVMAKKYWSNLDNIIQFDFKDLQYFSIDG